MGIGDLWFVRSDFIEAFIDMDPGPGLFSHEFDGPERCSWSVANGPEGAPLRPLMRNTKNPYAKE